MHFNLGEGSKLVDIIERRSEVELEFNSGEGDDVF